MLAAARAWVLAHPAIATALYATLFAAGAFAVTRPVLLVNDGHMYFEMARSLGRGTFELPNGLDIVDSPELWIENAVKRGPHLYPKYPPLYALLAAVPYALIGIRGLYLCNAIAFVVAMLAFLELGRRTLGPSRGLVATALLPFAVPLVPYMLMELPHLVALAPLLWAIVLLDDARQRPDGRRAALLATGAGLLAGLAFGVRIQDALVTLPLVAIGVIHSRRRGAVLGGFASGFVFCCLVISQINRRRFGSYNPFSYGPHDSALGAPLPEDGMAFFFRPAFVVVAVIAFGVLLAVRRRPRVGSAAVLSLGVALGAAVVAAVPPLRDVAIHTIATTASLLLNDGVAGAGWSSPGTTLGWVDKALLSSMPFLVLGLASIVIRAAPRPSPLPTMFAWMAAALLLFLSVRDPDPRTQRGAMGFLSLSPRYLVEIMPGLYLLAWDRLRDVRFRPAHLAAGLLAGAGFFVFMQTTGRDDLAPLKVEVLATDSIVAAGLLLWAYGARRAAGATALGLLVALTNGYAAACIFAEDSRCLLGMAAEYDRWGERILAAMPEPGVALVGWHYAKDAVFHVRASKPTVVTVDPAVDDSASLTRTLDALVASGLTPYYFGLGLERVAPHLEGHYRVVPVLDDPLLWRLDRLGTAKAPSHED